VRSHSREERLLSSSFTFVYSPESTFQRGSNRTDFCGIWYCEHLQKNCRNQIWLKSSQNIRHFVCRPTLWLLLQATAKKNYPWKPSLRVKCYQDV